MFSEDRETFKALNALSSLVDGGEKPLVVWLGAGASAWAGYPLWKRLAEMMHSRFARETDSYEKTEASALLESMAFPKLFQYMHVCDSAVYFSCLVDAFAYRKPTPVYTRLLKVLGRIQPTCILTTNVDESLERHLSGTETVQRSDAERVPQMLAKGEGFICKLHGSVSSIESMVFAEEDYKDVQNNLPLMNALRSVFGGSSVLFLGYGLRDEHVISALEANCASHPLFGTGPHFIVSPKGSSSVPQNVKRINYVVQEPDHRGALLALEAVADLQERDGTKVSPAPASVATEPRSASVCFIGELLPPGKMTTSQSLIVEGGSGTKEIVIGEGYVDGEVVLHDYSALHDLVVGLVCFDVICLSIGHLGKLHRLLGSAWFWRFVEAEAIRLVVPPPDPAVLFHEAGLAVGAVKTYHVGSKSSSMESFQEMTVAERIRAHVKAAPGKEREAERQMDMLEATTVDLAKALPGEDLEVRMRGAMLHPTIRRLLGISGGVPMGAVPRWLAFPILRLAGVVRIGVICEHLKASATRMVLGSEKLASVAFSASSGTEWVDAAASYALTGRFNSDLGALIEQQRELLGGVMHFRESSVGMAFRRDIADRLATNEGGQVTAAVNAGLREALPLSVLQQAHDELSGLFMPRPSGAHLSPAVWGDLRNGEGRIAGWRKRSKILLEEYCKSKQLRIYDECPCGSGEKVRFCCSRALR